MTEQAAIEADPFGCFGDDDNDDDSDCSTNENKTEPISSSAESTNKDEQTTDDNAQKTSSSRDQENGVLTFHTGTEQSLWLYLQRELETQQHEEQLAANKASSKGRKILQLMDQFCYRRHWMMAVGPEKGKILSDFLKEFCEAFQSNLSNSNNSDTCIPIIVELGTYCGYSAILIALTILETIPNANFHIYSVDVDTQFQAVACKIIKAAGLANYVTFILLPINAEDQALTQALRQQQQSISQIDFLFIDHDKNLYCSDLQELEESGFIHKGTHVAADNVVFFDTPYRSYIRQLKERGIVQSRLVRSHLEYFLQEELDGAPEVLQDGIGKKWMAYSTTVVVLSCVVVVVAVTAASSWSDCGLTRLLYFCCRAFGLPQRSTQK